jgi:hypothetical protein
MKIDPFNNLNTMAYISSVIAGAEGVGIPTDLVNIVASYAQLSDNERLEQFFRFGNTVESTVSPKTDFGYYNEPHSMFIQDTKSGIEISSSLTEDSRERMSHEYFLGMMGSGELDLDIVDDIPLWTAEYESFGALEVKLMRYWHSI